jgi:hypothetical protein
MRKSVLCCFLVLAWSGVVSAQPRAGNPRLPSTLRFRRVAEPTGGETVEHRQQTNAGIHNDMYLTLAGQADQLYDPNFDSNTNRTDFKRSAVRERP